ncbi:MAG TPA: TRAM domain-containing protein, partial [Tangfeifania sp.]|nr:TRAM domain-containing protein [Tangfeifania sp.]
WDDDVPQDEKKRRLHILTEELRKHNRVYNRQLEGKTLRVLIRGNDRKEGYLSSLTEGKMIVRFPSDDESLIGQFADLKITGSSDFSLEGELVNAEVFA